MGGIGSAGGFRFAGGSGSAAGFGSAGAAGSGAGGGGGGATSPGTCNPISFTGFGLSDEDGGAEHTFGSLVYTGPLYTGFGSSPNTLCPLIKTGITAPVGSGKVRWPITRKIVLIAPEWELSEMKVLLSCMNRSSRRTLNLWFSAS